jgi:UPF0755 protein
MPKKLIKDHLPLILTGLAAFFMVIIATLALLLQTPLSIPSPGVVFEVEPGVGVKILARQLKENEVIAHPRLFEWYTRMNGHDTAIQAGEYYFPQGISTRAVAKKLINGQVIKRSLRIQEGWTVHDLIAQVENDPLIKHTIDYADPNWFALISPELTHPEGQFMPDTYSYTKGMTDIQMLRRMHADLHHYLQTQWETRDLQVPYQEPYQALIAASIIEKETALPSEREAVAGVLVRRLKQGMRLQMDPTVIYGLGLAYNGKITKNDLKNDSPYNTYVNFGLPPTPISLPSRQSIYAALHPLSGTSLYFVAKGDGSHTFSDTLEEHNAAVLKYLKTEIKTP